MTSFYENYWQTRGRSGMRPRYQIFYGWIRDDSSVLEIGCGDGYFGEMLVKNKRVNYLGGDISNTALEIARKRGLTVGLLDATEDLNQFSDKSFDYVVMSEFIEHIPNSEEILGSAARIARHGILVSIPNIAYWRFRLQLLLGHFPKQWAIVPYEHLRFWSVVDFKKTVSDLGLKVEAMQSSNGKRFLRDLWPNLFGFQICFYLSSRTAIPQKEIL